MVREGNILDAFCGTGTASVVALKLGMNAVGFDKNLPTCTAALSRLSILPKGVGMEEELMTKAAWAEVLQNRESEAMAQVVGFDSQGQEVAGETEEDSDDEPEVLPQGHLLDAGDDNNTEVSFILE